MVYLLGYPRDSHLPKTAGCEVETKMVKKNARIITKLKVEMKVRGEMSYAECMAYVQAISKYGLTTGQLNNILAQHFNRVKDIRTISILGSSNVGSVWSVRP